MRKISDHKTHFWSSVQKGADNDCWTWQKSRLKSGHGVTWFDSKHVMAHRIAYFYEFGVMPIRGLVVMHKCDNPPCCNPRHLILGTQAENNADRDMKGRGRGLMERGSKHPNAKLTEDQVLDIRSDKTRGAGARMARKYEMTKTAISAIRNRKVWTHV
jgi:hypothetical protein